jgi:WD40 repeat protein
LGHPLLNTTAGWELFGRGEQVLVRVQPAAGRITRTTVPGLLSSGPVSFLAGSDRVIIRPLDRVPGYVVQDGRPARQLSPFINEEGPVFPGPNADQLWVQPADDRQPVLALATLEGKRLADLIPVPSESSSFQAVPDGAGNLLIPGIGGLYDASPKGLRRISTGSLLAVGPTGWLVVECDDRHRCEPVLINRQDGARRVVESAVPPTGSSGVISPDGATAAIMTPGPNGTVGLYLVDLASGRQRVLELSVNQVAFDGAVAFSPDSKWLFAVTADGSVAVVNSRTGSIGSLGTPLPPLSQLVIRPVGTG